VSTHQNIWDPHLQQSILLPISPTSFKKWTPKARYLNRDAINKLLASPLAPSVACQNALEGKHNMYLGRSFYVSITEITPISGMGFIIGQYLLQQQKRYIQKTT
jgi:hypothetical protein